MINPKITGLFLEVSEFGFLAAQTSVGANGLLIRSIQEGPYLFENQLKEKIQDFTKASRKQFSAATCGIYPDKKFIYKAELDNPIKGREDPSYFEKILLEKFKQEINQHTLITINPLDGSLFGAAPLPKQVLFCGAPKSDIEKKQDYFFNSLIYPDRLEMSTLAGIGGFLDYLKFKDMQEPVLLIEMGMDNMLCFIFKDKKIDNVRIIPYGVSHFIQECQKSLSIDNSSLAKSTFINGGIDVTSLDSTVLNAFTKDLQSFISFYELQFSTQVRKLFFTLLPSNLDPWMQKIADSLSIEKLNLDYVDWFNSKNISLSKNIDPKQLHSRWFNLISLMINPAF